MGFGGDVSFIFVLGLLLLGPKRMSTIVGHIARTKAQLKQAARSVTADFGTTVEARAHPQTINSQTRMGGEL